MIVSSRNPLVTSNTNDEWLTTDEVAAILKVKRGTLEKWRYLKKGPRHHIIGGSLVRYRRSEIEKSVSGGHTDG